MEPALLNMDDLLEEILFRFAADAPARLVHAGLVCKRWRRLRAPRGKPAAMLAVVCNVKSSCFSCTAPSAVQLVPTVPWFRPPAAVVRDGGWKAVDARHGRVLLYRTVWDFPGVLTHHEFQVWDPITDGRTAIPKLPAALSLRWNATVLCAAAGGCDHDDYCHCGPFLVVVLGSTEHNLQIYVRVFSSSSEDGSWSEPAYADTPDDDIDYHGSTSASGAIVGNTLYSMISYSKIIVAYNLDTRETSVIHRPTFSIYPRAAPVAGEDAGLRTAAVLNRRLYIWSRAEDADEGWALSQVIELQNVLPDTAFSPSSSNVIASRPQVFEGADGIGVILLWSCDGLFTIDLKSQQSTKICQDNILSDAFAYMSFHTPVLRLASKSEEEPSASASGDS